MNFLFNQQNFKATTSIDCSWFKIHLTIWRFAILFVDLSLFCLPCDWLERNLFSSKMYKSEEETRQLFKIYFSLLSVAQTPSKSNIWWTIFTIFTLKIKVKRRSTISIRRPSNLFSRQMAFVRDNRKEDIILVLIR